ncbi:methyl-CpG-binding domain-containing protein 5-like [Durio zibethinus]|uniref:Methyl-CpG-binding domain-containing protein 5-like n=1 Tax=Durio zibethinus TaxID=66656 RepID=A0A6P6ARZ4_DURZI|nr:methyl-CpG-binding domain-containing protein 5-like [Durio zibethinus]
MVDTTGDSTLTQKLSDKKEQKPEENLETEPKMDETDDEIITEAQPLAWKPPADNFHYQLLMPAYKDGQCYGLPKGWQVEQRPRTSPKYIGKVDQYYYEPGTNRQFRSLKAVRRHLQVISGKQHQQLPRPRREIDEQASKQKDEHTPVAIQHGHRSDEASRSSNGHSRNKLRRKRKRASSSFEFDHANPPEKVTWALTDAESDQWNPFVGEKTVPEAVKDLWVDTFVSLIYQKNKHQSSNL